MKRLDFLKKLGIGSMAIVAPSIFIKKENTQFINRASLDESIPPPPKQEYPFGPEFTVKVNNTSSGWTSDALLWPDEETLKTLHP